jgi:pyruvate dehydrogenase E1 component alpha subunit
MAVPNVADRAAAYGMPGVIVDGNDLLAVFEAAHEATLRARRGEGPTLLECKTYRLRGHSKSDRNLYRTKEEIEEWRRRDPIVRFREELTSLGCLTPDACNAIEAEAAREIDAAVEFARNSPHPDPAQLERGVYA